MRMNAAEKALMNNPVRRLVQRHFEAPRLLRMGGPCNGATALEVGCGQGLGVSLVLEAFGAARVDAFDLDPTMVELARARHRGDPRVRLWTGDAEEIRAADGTYDAVFDFGIIHHVPRWRSALREVRRVLRPGGRFYAEEVLEGFIHHPVSARLLEHPMDDRFDATEWSAALVDAGFDLHASSRWGSWFVWSVAIAR